MQADYFNFHQMAQPLPPLQQTFAAFGPFPYGFATPLPSNNVNTAIPLLHHRNLERLKKVKPKYYSDGIGVDSVKYDEAVNNSTDESIHLVKTRKTGESAPNRFESETSLKKRSQSGTSLMKGGSSAQLDEARRSHVRNQSEDRSLSPSVLNELRNESSPLNHMTSETASNKGGKSSSERKKRRERKLRKAGAWNYADQDSTAYAYADTRAIDSVYLSGAPQVGGYQTGYMPQQASGYMQPQMSAAYAAHLSGYAHQQQPAALGYPQYMGQEYPDIASSAHVQYAMEQQQQIQQQYPYQQYAAQMGYEGAVSAPGGPIDYSQYQQSQQQQPQYEANGFTQQSYAYSQQQQQQAQQQPQQIQQQQLDQSVMPTVAADYSTSVPVDYPSQSFGPVVEQQNNNYIPGLPPGAKIVAEYFLGYLDEPAQQQYIEQSQVSQAPVFPSSQQFQYQQQVQPQSSSESSKEDVDIEVWEKNNRTRDSHTHSQSQPIKSEIFYSDEEPQVVVERPRERRKNSSKEEDLRKLKDDIVKAIQKELGDLKLDNNNKSSEAVQPIFLMPKSSEQQKPIYIPRNIYVPVVRPVFVPRERIIVRPQIIHVARPVLVDRPVPIQQRPIVIERDGQVRLGDEKNDINLTSEGGDVADLIRNTEHAQEVTYHEFTQVNPSYPYGNEYEENRRKMEVMDLLDEAERKKLESKSNEDLVAQYNKYISAASGAADVNARTLDSLIGNSQGYTLEVLDQRVSDKFERTDSETIKARYGVDSYQYMPSNIETVVKGSGSSYIINNNSSEYYPNSSSNNQANQNLRASGSFKSISSAAELRNNNSSSNIFANYGDSNYGNLTMQGMVSPSANSRLANQTPVSMQKMVHSFGNSAYEQES